MTNIAFIGLGIMGSPMAVHLANAGHDVAGLQPAARQRPRTLVDAGGRAPARSPRRSRTPTWSA